MTHSTKMKNSNKTINLGKVAVGDVKNNVIT